MARKDYEGTSITVHWDSDRCIHSRLCVLGAPSVFDFEARPWVRPDGAAADEVARVIDSCPSGALSYTRTDGAPNGRRGRRRDEDEARAVRADDEAGATILLDGAADDVPPTITPLPDGPLIAEGPFAIARDDGAVEFVQRVTLCRCGHSASKPHCDGSHARVGFTAPGTLPPPRERQVAIRSSDDDGDAASTVA